MKKQTAGRDALGSFASKFAEINDDILFGEVWSRTDKLSLKNRSMITVVALITKGITDNSLKYHLLNAKANGVSKEEMVEVITHIAFYVGWPNAWAAFPLVKEVYQEENECQESLFGLGELNTAYEKYFIGKSYLKVLNTKGVKMFNVTFEAKSRNNWHIHRGGGQILLATDGEGWYQEENQKPRKLHPGDVVYIDSDVKHWHGASKDSWFTHIALEVPGTNCSTDWCEAVSDEEYLLLK